MAQRIGVGVDDAGAARREHAEQRRVVRLADGVELVVVAARAGDGLGLEGLPEDVDLVVDEADLLVQGIGGQVAVVDEPPVGGGEDRLVQAPLRIQAGLEQVARHVLPDEAVVGEVLVEGADQVVAVAIREGDLRVPLGAVGVGVADDVHPVPRPALAEVGGGEQAVHEALVGVGPRVGLEAPELLG